MVQKLSAIFSLSFIFLSLSLERAYADDGAPKLVEAHSFPSWLLPLGSILVLSGALVVAIIQYRKMK